MPFKNKKKSSKYARFTVDMKTSGESVKRTGDADRAVADYFAYGLHIRSELRLPELGSQQVDKRMYAHR